MKSSAPPQPGQLTIAGIPTIRATRKELAALMVADIDLARSGRRLLPRVVISSNGTVIAQYHLDSAFRELVRQADVIDADGMPLVMASRLLCKRPLPERAATTDFIHDAAEAAVAHGARFYFLGAQPGVAEEAAQKLLKRHAGLQIVGIRNGYFSLDQEQEICAEVVTRQTDVLWLGLGSPRQEAFAIRNRSRLGGVAWIRTCGGLFDHKAERFARAPAWMQASGLEWLFRAAQEPRRLGPRYLKTNPVAFYHLLTKTHD